MSNQEITCSPMDQYLINQTIKEEENRNNNDSNLILNSNKSLINQNCEEELIPNNNKTNTDTFDIVRAAQYGIFDRLSSLVEKGYNVNQMDQENVSILHWAAINNRIEIAKYLISKGAIVDRIGGDLKSTPLHWAIRQGHLAMVVLLMSFGSDPSVIDGEGCSGIHLASEFGHTAIVAYLVAKGDDVDFIDKNGLTPVMWSAYRNQSIDPTRLLLTFGAKVNLKDKVNGNSALHWACLANNNLAVRLLLEAEADLFSNNNKNESAFEIGMRSSNFKLRERLKVKAAELGVTKVTTVWQRIKYNKKLNTMVTYFSPLILFLIIGFILHFNFSYFIKIPLSIFIYFISRFIIRNFLNFKLDVKLPLAIYLSTKFWMYFTWIFIYSFYIESYIIQLMFIICSIGLFYNFYKVYKTDPGYVKTTIEDKIQAVLDLSERGNLKFELFCHSCISRKPIRSKHCSICDRCVLVFDHHCPWVDNCIGQNNHPYFIGYLFFLLLMILWCLYGSYIYIISITEIKDDISNMEKFLNIIISSPWVSWIFSNALVHFVWVLVLLSCQMYQIVVLASTTNERLNCSRYNHFKTNNPSVFRSPFHRGYFQNIIDFFQLECFGFFIPLKKNLNQSSLFSSNDKSFLIV